MGGIVGVMRGSLERNRKGMANVHQVALSPVSLVYPVVVLTALVRPPSVTSAVPVACSRLPRSGASGTRRSTLARSTQIRKPPISRRWEN